MYREMNSLKLHHLKIAERHEPHKPLTPSYSLSLLEMSVAWHQYVNISKL